MDGVHFRRSVEEDKEQLSRLMKKYFSVDDAWYGDNPYNGLNGRYLVAIDNKTDRLIAFTGMEMYDAERSRFNGHEVDWTACDEEFRGHGIVTELLREVIRETFEKDTSRPIYCSCWTGAYEDMSCGIHLKTAMKVLGFKEIEVTNVCDSKYMIDCRKGCSCFKDGHYCKCAEILYRLESIKK